VEELGAVQEQEQQLNNFPDLAIEDALDSTDPLDEMSDDDDGPVCLLAG